MDVLPLLDVHMAGPATCVVCVPRVDPGALVAAVPPASATAWLELAGNDPQQQGSELVQIKVEPHTDMCRSCGVNRPSKYFFFSPDQFCFRLLMSPW